MIASVQLDNRFRSVLPVLRPFRLELAAAFELGGEHRAFRPVVCRLCDIQPPLNVALNVIISASDVNSLPVIVSCHIGPRPWQLPHAATRLLPCAPGT
jgi:hypothetical protein